MELREALGQIADIHTHIARAGTFRGYRSVSTGLTGVVAIVAAVVQSILLPHPLYRIDDYLYIWCAAAMASIVIVGVELLLRYRRTGSILQRELSLQAIEHFVPCLVAGGLLTYAIVYYRPLSIEILPGLWAICFSLGVFASRRMLPKPTFLVAGFYLMAGLAMIATDPAKAFSPWAMGFTFGFGQLFAAFTLYWTLERHERKEAQ